MNNARSAALFAKEEVHKVRLILTALFLTNLNVLLRQSLVPQVSLTFSRSQESLYLLS